MVRILIDELEELIESKAKLFLLDVREPDEVKAGMMPGAKNLPLSELARSLTLGDEDFLERFGFQKFTKKDIVVVYCRSGNRSAHARDILASKGFHVLDYSGSMNEWSRLRPGKLSCP